ncbi:unnamed protein product [Leuciscus chuanchicus]
MTPAISSRRFVLKPEFHNKSCRQEIAVRDVESSCDRTQVPGSLKPNYDNPHIPCQFVPALASKTEDLALLVIDERGAVCEKNREIDWGSEQDKEVEERNRPKISQSWVWTARSFLQHSCCSGSSAFSKIEPEFTACEIVSVNSTERDGVQSSAGGQAEVSVCAGGCGLGTAGAKGHKDFCLINVCFVPAGHNLMWR